uniref:ODAD1 central coiled coil region domain-containing protein n=1 Tax=Arion vulgaris TaxID=1028688 RepID=A0A0B7B968_9EUPU
MKEQEGMQKELDAKIREWERKIKEHHKNVGGVNTGTQHTTESQKIQHVLENRLDQAKKRFNEYLGQNARLRDDIESYRNEHHKFESLYRKLEKELKNMRKDMAEVIESSTAAYESRDDAQAKMVMLQEKSDKDLQQHNAEMKELVRVIDHDRKLKEFMSIKGQDRQEDPQLVVWRQRKAVELEKKKESQEDSVETYEEAFMRIRDLTGQEDIDVLVKDFIKVEDTNFALFNYVNEQNNEIDKLNEDIIEIQKEIENFKKQGIELEIQRKQILKGLELRQTKAAQQADEYGQKHREVSKILDQLKSSIDSLFNKINCNRSVIDSMLGAATTVTDTNMIQYLGIIEQKTNELLAIQAYCNAKDQEKHEPRSLSC